MATKVMSNDPLPVDPEDELTRPESRPALRAAHSTLDSYGESPSGVGALPLDLTPELAAVDDEEDEVTQVDPKRGRLVSSEGPPPPDFPELE